jgi:RNA 3'-terminal phosphate cyclase (ATP)
MSCIRCRRSSASRDSDMEALIIDGSTGEGGGQILRTSLALAAITGTPVTIINIRSGRPKPGLQRQHLTAVLAAARVSAAELEGATLQSQELSFKPQRPIGGTYHFDIGSAGSTTLVLQTVLPILLKADGPSDVTITGGTHNPMAPTLEFLQESYLQALARAGVCASITLQRHGFYPAGGGSIAAHIEPWTAATPVSMLTRGDVLHHDVQILHANLPEHIAQREMSSIMQTLGWSHAQVAQVPVQANGPGNMIITRLRFAEGTTVLSACGELRKSAERVAADACAQVAAHLDGVHPVCEHLADQLLLPMALGAGGSFLTCTPSRHTRTNADIISRFLGPVVTMARQPTGSWLVEVATAA